MGSLAKKVAVALISLGVVGGIGFYVYNMLDTEAQVVKSDVHTEVKQQSKSLIVYFTYSENMGDTSGMNVDAITSASFHGEKLVAEGNMQVMVKEIQKMTGADVFSIIAQEAYNPNFDEMTNKAKADIEDNRQMELQGTLPDLSQYDVIYFGTPIWWYTLPAPVSSYLRLADFAGKTVVPFGIHRGSGFNQNLETIQELQPKAMLTDGFTIDARTPNEETIRQFDEFLDGLLK